MDGSAVKQIIYPFDCTALVLETVSDAEQVIAEIESLERILALPDSRPLTLNDVAAANRRHDQTNASSPWFKLWKDFGVCCHPEPSDKPSTA